MQCEDLSFPLLVLFRCVLTIFLTRSYIHFWLIPALWFWPLVSLDNVWLHQYKVGGMWAYVAQVSYSPWLQHVILHLAQCTPNPAGRKHFSRKILFCFGEFNTAQWRPEPARKTSSYPYLTVALARVTLRRSFCGRIWITVRSLDKHLPTKQRGSCSCSCRCIVIH